MELFADTTFQPRPALFNFATNLGNKGVSIVIGSPHPVSVVRSDPLYEKLERADRAEAQAAIFAQRLRELGVNPDELLARHQYAVLCLGVPCP